MIGPPPTPARRLVRQQRFQPRPLVLSQVMTIVHGDDLSHPTQKIHGTRPSAVDVGRALEPASRTFQLMVATLLGDWAPFAQVTLARDDDTLDVPVAFDPMLNPLPGLPLAQPFRSLREPAYRAARRARQDQAA